MSQSTHNSDLNQEEVGELNTTVTRIYMITRHILEKLESVESSQKKLSTSVIKLKTEFSDFKKSFNQPMTDTQYSSVTLTTNIQSIETKISEQNSKVDDLFHNHQVLNANITQVSTELQNLGANVSQNFSALDSSLTEVLLTNEEMIIEKRKYETRDKCQKIKNNLIVRWKDSLNKRKKAYWHYYQNKMKANLYKTWSRISPEYLPLKYRPQIINNEPHIQSKHRLEQARANYHADIDKMLQYSDQHQKQVQEIDHQMSEFIRNKTSTEPQLKILHNWWNDDITMNESISHEIWEKRSKFLETRKELEEKDGSHNFTNKHITWKNKPLGKKTFKYKDQNGNFLPTAPSPTTHPAQIIPQFYVSPNFAQIHQNQIQYPYPNVVYDQQSSTMLT